MHRRQSPPRLRFARDDAQSQKFSSSKKGGQIDLRPQGPLLYKMCKTESRLIRRVLEHHGFEETEGSDWNLMWMGVHLKPYMMQGMNKYQKVNHFPRTYELTRKDKMYQNIAKMRDRHGAKHWDFCPKTFNLPYEWNLFVDDYNRDCGDGVWIIKPNASSRGRGIHLISHPGEVSRDDSCVVSRYIGNPLLIDGFKFDLRIYVLITSFDPLRVYIYEEGLARFATEKYDRHHSTFGDRNMHLTNYSVNKHSKMFVKNEDADVDDCGHKWSLTALRRRLVEMNIDVEALWEDIHDLVIKSLISVESTVVPGLKTFVPHVGNCFELLGFDVLIDSNLKPWLVEVNLSPSLGTDSPLDRRIKNKLVANMFDLVGIQHYDRQQARTDAALARQKKELSKSGRPFSASSTSRRNDVMSAEAQEILQQTKEEYGRRGNFIRIFPCKQGRSYLKFFETQRPYNVMLLDLVVHDHSQFDERPYARELVEHSDAVAQMQIAMNEDISDDDGEEDEVYIEEDEQDEDGEDAWDAPPEDAVEDEPEEPPQTNNNLYARRAVEEFLCSLLERLAAEFKQDCRPSAKEEATARQLRVVADDTLSLLGNSTIAFSDPNQGNSRRISAIQNLLRQYKERSQALMSEQTKQLEKPLEDAANLHLSRFRQELRLASVEDLGRFLRRFVGEMPRVAPTAAKPTRPKTCGHTRSPTRPTSPQFPGQQTQTRQRPRTVGPAGRVKENTENTMQNSPSRTSGEPARRSMSATRRPPTTNTVGGAGSSVRKLFVGHSHRSQPVILSNQSNQRLSSSQSSLQSSVYGSRPQSRPMSAGTTLRSRKKTSKSSEGMATSFADRIRNLTMQAQLHPRSNSKPASSKSRRPQSAKFAK